MAIPSHFRPLALLCITIARAHSAEWGTEHALATAAYDRGDYSAAEQHDRAALTAAGSFAKNDLRLEATLTQLGAVLQARGVCCEADLLLRQALGVRESRFGKNSIENALGQNNLAAVWQQAGRTEEARKLQAEALATAERVLQPGSRELVPFLTLAALTERDSARYERAEELLKRALVLAESDAAKPRRLLQVWKYLGSVYRSAGRFDAAEQAYRTSVSISESRYGVDSLDTATALANLGGVLCQRQFYVDARPYLLRAVAIYQRIHEEGLPSFAATLQSLVSAELYLGQAQSAQQHALLAVEVLKKQTVVNPESLAVAESNLGQVYAVQGRYKEAQQATMQAKDTWLETAGYESSKVAAAISNLGALYVKARKYKKAEALYLEASAIDRKLGGADSIDYARDLNRLGVLYNQEKHFSKAEEVLRKALEIDSKKLGPSSPVLTEPYVNLAVSLQGQHRPDDSLECYRRGIEIMANAGQKNAPRMAVVLEQYSSLLRAMQRWSDAEKASTEALGILVKEKVNGETYR